MSVVALHYRPIPTNFLMLLMKQFTIRGSMEYPPRFEDAIEHGEMVTPPAGAVGRGDGFILRIAEKSGALVLSNDSFQEFHAERPLLFEPGRLIGGKPVPGVGWVFTPRTPVRGPRSRSVTAKSKRESKASDEAVDVSDGARGVEGGETDGVDAAVKSRRSRRRRGSRGSGGSPVAETTKPIDGVAAPNSRPSVGLKVEAARNPATRVRASAGRIPVSSGNLPRWRWRQAW